MPRFRTRRTRLVTKQKEYLDLNDRFVAQICIIYFLRILRVRPIGDSETLEFLCWLIGEERIKLSEYVQHLMAEKMEEDYDDGHCRFSAGISDFANDLEDLLGKASWGQILKFTNHAKTVLESRLRTLEQRKTSEIQKNLDVMRKMFSLSDTDISLCTFLFIIAAFSEPESFFDNHLKITTIEGRKYLLKALDIPQFELTNSLTGKLKTTGIISFERGRYNDVMAIGDDFYNFLLNPSEKAFAKKLFSRCQEKALPLDFHLIEKERLKYMQRLLSQKTETPTHILLYGLPGTGKSSFAESIAGETGLTAYKINTDTHNKSMDRRAAIIACMNLTNESEGSVIIVDEADNLLNTEKFWFQSGETQDKGWLNQLLEKHNTRMIWISNRISEIDESVLRRFSYSHHFKPYSRKQRAVLWENIVRRNRVKRLFSESDLSSLSNRYNINAGVIDLAVKKAKTVAEGSRSRMLKALKLSIESYKTVINGGKAPVEKNMAGKEYTLDGLNVSSNLDKVLSQLKKYDKYLRSSISSAKAPMNLLFFGPPGTGKSELAKYISKELDRKILLKRASDLLDPYVGGTEALISKAFRDAESDDAVLIIDEADTFLYNRERAVRSWEVSFTNEFLAQMEQFSGILICSTNRFDHLDQASIRRFSHKIEFDYLTPEGNVIFYENLLSSLAGAPMAEAEKQTLRKIKNLAPGDFKTVRTRYAFYPKADLSHDLFISELIAEADIKMTQMGSFKIGFN